MLHLFAIEKIHYPLSNEPLDVVIPCTKKDLDTLNLCIDGIRKHGKNIRRIIVVSSEKYTDKAEWFDEKKYPFNKYDIALQIYQSERAAIDYILSKNNRIGWIYQQFLKLYAAYVIPDISSNILVLDSDTIFLKDVTFLTDEGGALFNVGQEYHIPYFRHMERLLPYLNKVYPNYSGICHHMVFQRPLLDDLFYQVKAQHNTELWRAICNCIDLNDIWGSCFSEYEIYFNFAFLHTDQMHIRPLMMLNTPLLKSLELFKAQGYDYVSCHAYMRKSSISTSSTYPTSELIQVK